MRRDPRENSRGLVDPRDAPELLDNDGYGLYGEEEPAGGIDPTKILERQPVEGIGPVEPLDQHPVEGIDPVEIQAVANVDPGKDKDRNTAHGIKSCSRPSARIRVDKADLLLDLGAGAAELVYEALIEVEVWIWAMALIEARYLISLPPYGFG
ncbi:MAG: hypothetical protein Q9212_003284 [Teloschistes hypoglaucus]